jgi:prepilin-type N-terminal cleavage/methylation domain-containing protein
MSSHTRYKIQDTRYNFFRKAKKGFTMLELLIVIAITAILSVGAVSLYANQQKAKILDNTAQEIANYLRYAQQKSVSQEQGLQWGVHFDNPSSGSDFYALYTGTTYSSPIETKYLPTGIIFTTPATGNSINISFNKLTGTSTSQSLVIQSTSSNATKTISVSSQGLITY